MTSKRAKSYKPGKENQKNPRTLQSCDDAKVRYVLMKLDIIQVN